MTAITRRTIKIIAAIFAVFAMIATASAQERAPEIYMDSGGVFGRAWDYAVGGVDVVAYRSLEEGAAPVQGTDEFTTEYKGVSWRFASQENLDAFVGNPDYYRPEYGGYCAWAVAEGKLAKGDPRHWHIHNDKLYLNVSAGIKRRWLRDLGGYLEKSERNWPGVLER
ncbi:MAG: YHS domain-containing (seleno)protein [Pseudomonadota bacterium]